MGVLRLVPDAFADKGWSGTRAAVARGRRMISERADIVEIACTPCHAEHRTATLRTTEVRQAQQVTDLVGALAGDVRVAVATGSPELAAAGAAAGATLICDRSAAGSATAGPTVGPAADPSAAEAAREGLIAVAAGAGAGWVAVHASPAAPAPSREPGERRSGTPILTEVLESLGAQIDRASAAGIQEVYLDPGIGCGRAGEEDLDLLGGLERLAALGRPLVVGTGDGRLIDELHAAADTGRLPAPDAAGEHAAADTRHLPVADPPAESHAERLEGALVVAVWAMLAGAAVLRTQHVAATVQAARTVGAKDPVGTP